MNRLNCLVRDEPDQFGELVTLIDYEFASTNARGVDLAGHFCVWLMGVNNATGLSGLSYPSEDIRRDYLMAYLDETKLQAKFEFDENGRDSLEHLTLEVDFYAVVMSLFYQTWILDNSFGMDDVASAGVSEPDAALISMLMVCTVYLCL